MMPTGQRQDCVLVVNAGSSSLKLSVVDSGGAITGRRDIDHWDGSPDAAAVTGYLSGLADSPLAPRLAAVGHRVVHGGDRFTAPTLVDPAVRAAIEDLAALAPLHQPRALAGLDAAAAALPDLPQVACFDTAFHATIPPEAATYALPADWRDRFGLRKYGFHGLSHGYAARRAAELLGVGDPGGFRVVTCHLGAGSSLAAVSGGRSVETTMGFTPVDGLVMATRSGSVDPGLIAWLAGSAGIGAAELADGLEHRSGLAGLAGLADGGGDLREVAAAARQGSTAAALAVGVHNHRLVAQIAVMAAAMNGLDALVFTGGIGEHQPDVRAAATGGLRFLGVAIDAGRNAAARGDAEIGTPGAAVRTLVVTAREDAEIARQVLGMIPV
jgi:acetate kinase